MKDESTITVSSPIDFMVGDHLEVEGFLLVVTAVNPWSITVRDASWWRRLWFWIRRKFR